MKIRVSVPFECGAGIPLNADASPQLAGKQPV
jgi:hypothetical protein